MTYQRVTIKDLASELGISTSTVSRALRGHKDINKKTAMAVKKLAKERDYEPDAFALMLKQQSSQTIGVVVPDISHHFFASFVSSIQDAASKKGYRVIICQSGDNYERELSILQSVFATRIDGLAIAVSKETKDMTHISRLQKRGLPITFFDRANDSVRDNTIVSDDYNGACVAVKHLHEQGYQKIAYISSVDDHLLLNEVREDGYRDTMESVGGDLREEWVVKVPEASMVHGLEAGLKLLSMKNRPDAFFVADDHLALGILQAAKAKNLRIPQDIGLVGYGNAPFTQWTNPTITTINQSSGNAGGLAFKLLHQQMTKEPNRAPMESECHVLDTSLIVRESSQKNLLG